MKNKNESKNQRSTATEITPDFVQPDKECGGVKHVHERSILLIWC